MAHKRTNFTDRQKARIYVRDRATCSFSGLSLWLPDRGVTPNFLADWVDHVVPSARGGLATLENGVCASHVYNVSKAASGRAPIYLFEEGGITWDHLTIFGAPPSEQLAALERRAALVESDWYLNRAIEKALIALRHRANLELYGSRPVRDEAYWFRAGWKKLGTYLRTRPERTATERGLIADPSPHGTSAMMEIERVGSEADYLEWAETLWPSFFASVRAMDEFNLAEGDDACTEVAVAAADDPLVHPDIARGLRIMLLEPPGNASGAGFGTATLPRAS